MLRESYRKFIACTWKSQHSIGWGSRAQWLWDKFSAICDMSQLDVSSCGTRPRHIDTAMLTDGPCARLWVSPLLYNPDGCPQWGQVDHENVDLIHLNCSFFLSIGRDFYYLLNYISLTKKNNVRQSEKRIMSKRLNWDTNVIKFITNGKKDSFSKCMVDITLKSLTFCHFLMF